MKSTQIRCITRFTDPYIQKNEQWEFIKFTYNDPTSSFYFKMDEIKTIDGWAKARGTVRVQVSEPVVDLKPYAAEVDALPE